MKVIKNCILLILLGINIPQTQAQVGSSSSSLVLTTKQLKTWQVNSPKASSENVVSIPLQERIEDTSSQLNPSLSNHMKVIFAPDGMNNLGNFLSEQKRFNLYNFTHWHYIDRLIWFGGTADSPILIPAAPWVNTAHRNGVKVYGNIFFAPNAFGGSSEKVADFLEKDDANQFIVSQKLKDIIEYYNFDGWFINMETSVNEVLGTLIYDFIIELKNILPKNKEVIWYDAMLPNGKVNWQNQLNDLNKKFFQQENKRVSDGILINFFWKGDQNPKKSKTTAQELNRSEYDVYMGIDLWPKRNQKTFETGGNDWMSSLHSNHGKPITSIALFAPDVIFRNETYSYFQKDTSQSKRFYETERQLFGGKDQNPLKEDKDGFKGLSYWLPASTIVHSIPFETNFNTGHGKNKFAKGKLISTDDWHDIQAQDILPTWQFAIVGKQNLSTAFMFDDAYQGGSCVQIQGEIQGKTLIKLYKTKLGISKNTHIDLIYKQPTFSNTSLRLALVFSDDPSKTIYLETQSKNDNSWINHEFNLSKYAGKELIQIALQILPSASFSNIELKLGHIKVYNKK